MLATTVRERQAVERIAGLAGWRTRGASLDQDGSVGATRVALGDDVAAVAVVGEPATSREETAALEELASVVAGVAARPIAPRLVLVGELARDDLPSPAADDVGRGPLYAPGPESGEPPGEPLRRMLDRLDPSGPTPRRSALRALLDLAVILDRRIELVEVGIDGALRAVAGPRGLEGPAAIVPAAGLVPPDLDDEAVDEVLAWSTIALDRHRMRDRLRELRLAPWVEAHGDGARLRMAAARAAVSRLVRSTPWLDERPAPDLIVVSGGAWSAAPGPAIALAIADVIRRPGASQLAFDHARLLGPLGSIDEPDERRLLADLADDLLAPLGSVMIPPGMRAGRGAGRLIVHGAAGATELDLVPGGLELVDLPPGQVATATSSSATRSTSAPAVSTSPSTSAVASAGCSSTCATCPCSCPSGPNGGELLAAWERAFWAGHDG